MANFMDYEQATTLFTAVGEKFDALAGAYVYKGSSTLANLPSTITASMVGYVYNMSEAFTTTSAFVEGAGNDYPAGTNVAIANVGSAESPSYKFDVLAGFIDVDAIEDRIDTVAGDLADAFDDTSAYAIGDIVIYEDQLYKFTSAHTANTDWDATEVISTTVEELIAAAEPDSLTTAQVNALLALLD